MQNSAEPDLKKFEAKLSLHHVFDELKHAIMMGEFAPGTKIRIDEYAKIFNTSHMPVREALNQLQIVGALDGTPRKSSSIPLFSENRLNDLMDLRLSIEGHAIERAALRVRRADLRDLAHVQQKMQAMIEGADSDFSLKSYLKLNHRFHFRIYKVADNPQLFDMIELAWLRYGPMLNLLGRASQGPTAQTLQEGNVQHLVMLNALQDGDGPVARNALKADLSDAAERILRASA